MNTELKDEWLNKIKNVDINNVSNGYGFFSIKTEFYKAPEEIRLDKDITLKVLLESGEYLWNIHEKFKGDKQFILDLLNSGNKYTEDIYRALPHELKIDKEIFQKCIHRDKEIPYYHIPNVICLDKELIKEALKKFNLLDIVQDHYKYDKEMNLTFFNHHSHMWNKISKRMQNHLIKEKSIMYCVVEKFNYYSYLSEKNKVNLELIELALNADINNFSHIPEVISNNKSFILDTLKKYRFHGFNLNHIVKYPELLNDFELVKEFINNNGKNLTYLKPEFKNNKELAILSIKTYPHYLFSSISYELKQDEEIVNLFLKSNLIDNYSYVPQEFKTKEYSLLFLKNKSRNYSAIPESFKNDFHFNLEAIKINTQIYQELSYEFKTNIEIIYEHIKDQIYISNDVLLTYDKNTMSMDFKSLKSLIYKDCLLARLERESSETNNLANNIDKKPIKKLKI